MLFSQKLVHHTAIAKRDWGRGGYVWMSFEMVFWGAAAAVQYGTEVEVMDALYAISPHTHTIPTPHTHTKCDESSSILWKNERTLPSALPNIVAAFLQYLLSTYLSRNSASYGKALALVVDSPS